MLSAETRRLSPLALAIVVETVDQLTTAYCKSFEVAVLQLS